MNLVKSLVRSKETKRQRGKEKAVFISASLLLASLLLSISAYAKDTVASSDVQAVEGVYKSIPDISADFEQQTYVALIEKTVAKQGKKNIFSGRILEIEGLPDLKIEQAFELTDASAERSAHGQGLAGPPRQVIRAIPGVELREMKESNWCCGMAGSFALKELETSRKILERKLANVRATGADALVTANPGCHLQLAWGVRELAMQQPVLHIVELLGKALPS